MAIHLNVAGCYIANNGKFLMLKRANGKSESGMRGLLLLKLQVKVIL